LEKARCDHIKATAQAEAAFSIDDTKDPSAEATLVGGKFYSDVWVNGGRELANEIIKKNEKDTHDAREEARRAEEAAERERRIVYLLQLNCHRCRNHTTSWLIRT
jgi:predicted transcriptional regulator of viral defense system